MNKLTAVVLTAVLVLASGLTFAQDTAMNKDGMMDKGDKGGMMGMMGKGMMGDKCMMMGMTQNGMMMKMMEKTVIATTDGGVVVVTANKISKFDKDLNLVKEADLKMDMDGMHTMMSDMMAKCPMMNKGMKGGMGQDAGKTADAPVAAGSEVDHASHH